MKLLTLCSVTCTLIRSDRRRTHIKSFTPFLSHCFFFLSLRIRIHFFFFFFVFDFTVWSSLRDGSPHKIMWYHLKLHGVAFNRKLFFQAGDNTQSNVNASHSDHSTRIDYYLNRINSNFDILDAHWMTFQNANVKSKSSAKKKEMVFSPAMLFCAEI